MLALTKLTRRAVPARALSISLAALAVPVAGALAFPERLGEYGALLWLLALVPAFLLAYYRGWKGVATALAAGMATLSVTEVVAIVLGRQIPDMLLGIVVAYLAIAMGIGWLAEVLHRDRNEVEDLAFTDLLTHLPNRRHAEVFLENEFAAAERGRQLAVVLFDLDHFKRYNDTYGHQAGDAALETFADVLARTTRRMNLSARYGGEEFLSVLAGSDAEGAYVFADRVRTALRAHKLGASPLTVSAGVASYEARMGSPEELLAAADRALYQAKKDGRNCVRVFGEGPLAATRLREEPWEPPRDEGTADGDRRQRGRAEREEPSVPVLPEEISALGAGHRVLLVEDEDQVRKLIARYLSREGFWVVEAADVRTAEEHLNEEFDVVLTDIHLPGASGHELVRAAKARWPLTQVIVITGLQDAQVATNALNAGADRYLFKPFGMPELRAHLSDALFNRERLLADHVNGRPLSAAVEDDPPRERSGVLRGARALVRAVEVRDPYTRGHCRLVASFAELLADAVDPDGRILDRKALRIACELHDVGKIAVPEHVLAKEGRLDGDEMGHVRRHASLGRRILEPLLKDETVLSVVVWHHERWDGSGYPDGLAGEHIPLAARVVALADALAAMIRPRAYRDALSLDEAIAEAKREAGGQFDPHLVRLLEDLTTEVHRLSVQVAEGAAETHEVAPRG